MKKILPFILCLVSLYSHATTWNVTVESYQFTPATLNVMVGDVIHWTWIGGTHTTTSVSVPMGASTWDSPINTTQKTFDYTVTTAGTYNYECSFHSFLGMTASFTASGSLPVVLSSFTVINKNNLPLLSWSTLQEVNTDYFSVKKSTDAIHFKEIAKVSASGNSSVQKNYSFTDHVTEPAARYVYYTITIIDKDGKAVAEPIKMFRNNLATNRLIISISPNPVSSMGHINLQYNADKKGLMIATLSDMQGKVVMKEQLSSEPGINYGHLHFMNIPAGVYTIHFSLDGMNESYLVIKN
jgi:plastocyanin